MACDKEGERDGVEGKRREGRDKGRINEREKDGERELLANIITSCLPESGGV